MKRREEGNGGKCVALITGRKEERAPVRRKMKDSSPGPESATGSAHGVPRVGRWF